MIQERQSIKPMNSITAWGLLGLVLFIIWLSGYKTVAQYAVQQKYYLAQTKLLVQKQQALMSRAGLIEAALNETKLERQKIKYLIDLREGNPISIFQSLIRKLAKDTGIKLTKIQMPKINTASRLQIVSVKVEGLASIENVRDFLKETTLLQPLIRIDSLDLISVGRDTNKTLLNISLQASALMDNRR
tara:strand:- start:380 stop:943 length:564 start_codon:yes stop_codon:yes gene_type:complete